MSAPASHPCAACGGTKVQPGNPFNGALDVAGVHGPRGGWWRDCSVCAGAGRLPDRMPAADALADAETLRRISDDIGGPDWSLDHSLPQSVWAKLSWKFDNAMYMASEGHDSLAKGWTYDLARAAFRAVPGLRGDK